MAEISVKDCEDHNNNRPNEQDVNEVEFISVGSDMFKDSSLGMFVCSEILQENIPST